MVTVISVMHPMKLFQVFIHNCLQWQYEVVNNSKYYDQCDRNISPEVLPSTYCPVQWVHLAKFCATPSYWFLENCSIASVLLRPTTLLIIVLPCPSQGLYWPKLLARVWPIKKAIFGKGPLKRRIALCHMKADLTK